MSLDELGDFAQRAFGLRDRVKLEHVPHAFPDAQIATDSGHAQTTREAQPVYGRMYQTPFSDHIRNEVGIATIAVGNIYEADHVNSIIAAGRADLCAIARPHLADPAWTLPIRVVTPVI